MEEQKETKFAVLVETQKEELLQTKKEKAKEILFSNISYQTQKQEEKKLNVGQINFTAQDSFASELAPNLAKTSELKEEIVTEETSCEAINDNSFEEETSFEEEVTFEKENIKEESKNEAVSVEFFENKQLKPKRNLKSRLKLAIVACALILTCVGGWGIYNAIEIKTLTAEMQAKNAEYSVNVATVISNISKLDDLSNPNSITNLDELEKAEVIKIIPKNSSAPLGYEQKSNWFDRICNWLSNLFK